MKVVSIVESARVERASIAQNVRAAKGVSVRVAKAGVPSVVAGPHAEVRIARMMNRARRR